MHGLPNTLTILRILLVPLFVASFLFGETGRLVAFAVFCVAGISDALDGFAARKLGAGSDFGRMLDPIADKILVAVALMMLVWKDALGDALGGYTLIPALVILSREILVSGLREFLAGADVSVPVTRIAKAKTAMQMVAIGAMILGPIVERVWAGAMTAAYVLLWLAAALTVYTGYAYLRTGLNHVRPART